MDTELIKHEKAGIRLFAGTRPYAGLTREERQILEEAIAARDEWVAANADFNYADDALLVDYHIYRLKACEARYTYFLRLVKEKGLASKLNCHNFFNMQV